MRGGGAPKNGGQACQALGRSRGGFSTKIHVSVDGLGNPLRFILTGGQRHDITQAEELIAGYAGEQVLADKGYDSQEFREHILALGMTPVIPPRSNRKEPAGYDRHLYRERHLVECFINKIKHYRRIFSRFEKLDTRYLGLSAFHRRSHLVTLKCQHNLETGSVDHQAARATRKTKREWPCRPLVHIRRPTANPPAPPGSPGPAWPAGGRSR